MSHFSGCLKAAVAIAVASGFTTVHADHGDAYVVRPLVSNVAGAAPKVDGVLRNAWGIAFSPAGSPFWISDNATGCSTLYDGEGTKVPLQVVIPLPGGVIPSSACRPVVQKNSPTPAPAAPTGMVWNASAAFLVPGTTIPAAFIFSTEDGTLAAWAGGLSPANNAVLAVDNSAVPSVANHAVYKGLAFGVNKRGLFLFATNFRSGRIDVFGPSGGVNGRYMSASTDGGFVDPQMPAGYAPFGISNIDGDLFVTYAQQDDQKHDDVAGDGRGFVDVFDTDGHLLRRFASRGTLNSPWGVTRASFDFGPFSGKILIGNFGNGRINVFNNDGAFVDQLEDVYGNPLTIDGLWALSLGGGRNSNSDTLYFSAGPNEEANGLFGTISPVRGRK
ncbi:MULTISPECIES: TIGR03118 family protein [unclassified Caballeronia]|uniref:TIGR03118 family protein n=1 Tax=unclassified Caballeronia TaxID=2646786 RepID=UPI0020299A54|nr:MULTISPECIES: TIGR03118 family protein [unclassified Caballeronia]